MKKLLLIALLGPFLASLAQTQWETTDCLIWECLNDATRLEEAHHLIDSVMAQPDVERQPFYPVLLYRRASWHLFSGRIEQARQPLPV